MNSEIEETAFVKQLKRPGGKTARVGMGHRRPHFSIDMLPVPRLSTGRILPMGSPYPNGLEAGNRVI